MKLKRIILQIIFHVSGWILVYILPLLFLQAPLELPDSTGEIVNWIIVIAFFYVNYFWLIPAFLSKHKFVTYFAGISLMLATTYFTNFLIYSHAYHVENTKNVSAQKDTNDKRRRSPGRHSYYSAFFCFAVLAAGTSIKVTQGWYVNEKQKKEMENQKLTAELSYLKSQINPHFFFNTLNSIYSLAIKKSDKTPEAVVKLSELMRYIIYETERKLVPLSKEIEYITNYIELQRLRLPEDVKIEFNSDLGQKEGVIEPLLLLPFVENAFKHGVDVEKGGIISIDINRDKDELLMKIVNPLVDKGKDLRNSQSGIGLSNTLKRLQLLYHDNYSFTKEIVEEKYIATLTLKLKGDALPDS